MADEPSSGGSNQHIPSKIHALPEVGCNSTLVSLYYPSLPSAKVYSGNANSLIIGHGYVCLGLGNF